MERQFPTGLPYHPSQGVQRVNRPPRLSAADREASRLSPESSAVIPASQSSSSSDKSPISGEQVIRLVREAVLKAVATKKGEDEDEAAAAPEETSSPRPGLTIDLSRRNISALPDEVVDMLQNGLERSILSMINPKALHTLTIYQIGTKSQRNFFISCPLFRDILTSSSCRSE